jgi:DNA polymerase-4
MDAFYASVEERDRPELRGRPVIVGGCPEGRGVVAAANYVARRWGVHSAMPAAVAVRRCPDAVFLPVRMEHYAAVARRIRAIFHRYTPLVEPLSLDEAFLDVSASQKLFGAGEAIGGRIKREIADELGLVASVGVAPNKFLAKIASDLDKPDGFVVVSPGSEAVFLGPLPVTRIWGVGKVGARAFHQLGIRSIGQLQSLALPFLHTHFGNQAEHLWRLARGIDSRPVVPDHAAKSLSHETTFAADLTDPDQLRGCLIQLTEQVGIRLRDQGKQARTVQIKVRFADFQTLTRAQSLAQATDASPRLWRAVRQLFDERLPRPLAPVRLLGVGLSGLISPDGIPRQGELFEGGRERERRLDAAADAVRSRFGSGSLQWGAGLRRRDRGG